MIVIDLSKEKAPDANPKAIQQIIFAGNLWQNAKIIFILEEVKLEDYFGLFSRNRESIENLFCFNIMLI